MGNLRAEEICMSYKVRDSIFEWLKDAYTSLDGVIRVSSASTRERTAKTVPYVAGLHNCEFSQQMIS